MGVDTHQRTHHAAVLDAAGVLLGDREFAASAAGYAELLVLVELDAFNDRPLDAQRGAP